MEIACVGLTMHKCLITYATSSGEGERWIEQGRRKAFAQHRRTEFAVGLPTTSSSGSEGMVFSVYSVNLEFGFSGGHFAFGEFQWRTFHVVLRTF